MHTIGKINDAVSEHLTLIYQDYNQIKKSIDDFRQNIKDKQRLVKVIADSDVKHLINDLECTSPLELLQKITDLTGKPLTLLVSQHEKRISKIEDIWLNIEQRDKDKIKYEAELKECEYSQQEIEIHYQGNIRKGINAYKDALDSIEVFKRNHGLSYEQFKEYREVGFFAKLFFTESAKINADLKIILKQLEQFFHCIDTHFLENTSVFIEEVNKLIEDGEVIARKQMRHQQLTENIQNIIYHNQKDQITINEIQKDENVAAYVRAVLDLVKDRKDESELHEKLGLEKSYHKKQRLAVQIEVIENIILGLEKNKSELDKFIRNLEEVQTKTRTPKLRNKEISFDLNGLSSNVNNLRNRQAKTTSWANATHTRFNSGYYDNHSNSSTDFLMMMLIMDAFDDNMASYVLSDHLDSAKESFGQLDAQQLEQLNVNTEQLQVGSEELTEAIQQFDASVFERVSQEFKFDDISVPEVEIPASYNHEPSSSYHSSKDYEGSSDNYSGSFSSSSNESTSSSSYDSGGSSSYDSGGSSSFD